MNLRDRWLNLCSRIKAKNGEEVWPWLEKAYTEPHRHYHNFNHIEHCLQELDSCDRVQPIVELAIWFHDTVYDTTASDNEEKSAELAQKAFEVMGLPNGYTYFTLPLILATKHNSQHDPQDPVFLDIDLAILGQPREVFQKYEDDIRREYAWVPLVAYCDGRSRILEQFLTQKTIYRTTQFQERYEATARENLKFSLEYLAQQKLDFLIEQIVSEVGQSGLRAVRQHSTYQDLIKSRVPAAQLLNNLKKTANVVTVSLLTELYSDRGPERSEDDSLSSVAKKWLLWGTDNLYIE